MTTHKTKFETFLLIVEKEWYNLIISCDGIGMPDISTCVDEILNELIGTHIYRKDVYAPNFNYQPKPSTLKLVNGQVQLVKEEGSIQKLTYTNFFNAELIIKNNIDSVYFNNHLVTKINERINVK